MTCKDCVYYPACNYQMWCDLFKDKANFVEVVRCKDCKHFTRNNGGYCEGNVGLNMTNENQYCSFGELKESNDEKTNR